ncbi:MAG: hypothetical protein U5K55_12130 [Aliarcobacter sp.]|nr:hypothetical protein [Aliarcobacter sp.]
MPLKIKNATPKDSQTIFNFIMELAIYGKLPKILEKAISKYLAQKALSENYGKL